MNTDLYYHRILRKIELFNYDSIQFFININTSKSDKREEKCVICLDNEIELKLNCCNSYYHNLCLYNLVKFTNPKIHLEYKKINIYGNEYEILTNNINEECSTCRQELDNCDIDHKDEDEDVENINSLNAFLQDILNSENNTFENINNRLIMELDINPLFEFDDDTLNIIREVIQSIPQ